MLEAGRTQSEVPTEEPTFGDIAAEMRRRLDVFDIDELAALLDLDRRTLGTWRARGIGPDFVRLGRSILYRRAAVEAWINVNEVPTDRVA